MEEVRVTIDGHSVTVAPGTTILQAALAAGIHIPTLCHHKSLTTNSNCRACLVELEGARTLAPACHVQVREGLNVQTNSDRVRHARRMVFELLMTEADLTAAPEILACARYYGADPNRYPATMGAARERPVIMDNPFFVRDYSRCISCQRCVAVCGADVQHTYAIAMMNTGHAIVPGAGSSTNSLMESPCVFCGNCVGQCPTAALSPIPEYEARQAGLLETPTLTWTPETGFSPALSEKEAG